VPSQWWLDGSWFSAEMSMRVGENCEMRGASKQRATTTANNARPTIAERFRLSRDAAENSGHRDEPSLIASVAAGLAEKTSELGASGGGSVDNRISPELGIADPRIEECV
jgi:hypothetical protein